MAWATERACAQRFADRWTAAGCAEGLVFSVTITPDAVLAMIDDRGEAEVVVDPRLLPPLRRANLVPTTD